MFPTQSRAVDVPSAVRRFPSRALPASLALAFVLILGAGLLSGCGGGDTGDDRLLASVNDHKITASYYEDRLAKMEEVELPRDKSGALLDTGTFEGRREFLETLITKEVMSLTAEKLGYASEPEFVNARETVLAYEAGLALRSEAVDEPSRLISDEELNRFYERFGSSRQCRYVITNFLADAEAARDMARSGADWDDVAAKYHDGEIPPDGKLTIKVPFGRYHAAYEAGVFDTPVGEVTEPLHTDYGYWVLKIDKELPGKRPPLDEVKERIIEITYKRKYAMAMEDFRLGLQEKYGLKVYDEALLKAYQALPEGEEIFYPGTDEPVKREDLRPLDIAPRDLDLPFYEYTAEGERHLYTLGDYKTSFDRMSVFQRPKVGEMMGGMRQKIVNDLENSLVQVEARAQGLRDRADIVAKVDKSIEEMVVSKLYQETVKFDENVEFDELQVYYDANMERFQVPESRSGMLLIAENETAADAAYAALLAGDAWASVMERYNRDAGLKENGGRIDDIRSNARGPGRDALFALDLGEVGTPFAVGDGRFAVVRLDRIDPPRVRELTEVTEDIGNAIRQQRKEEAFQNLLAEWRSDLDIVVHEDRLEGLRSWQELKEAEAAALAAKVGIE